MFDLHILIMLPSSYLHCSGTAYMLRTTLPPHSPVPQRYRVRMVPTPSSKGSTAAGGLKVSARRLTVAAAAAVGAVAAAAGAVAATIGSSSSNSADSAMSSPSSEREPAVTEQAVAGSGEASRELPAAAPLPADVVNNIVPGGASGAAAVAQGLAQMFSSLQLNLQGIELSKPGLTVVAGEAGGAPMLEIAMKMRIRSLPPLDMQF